MADSSLWLFALSLYDPGSSDGQCRNISNTQNSCMDRDCCAVSIHNLVGRLGLVHSSHLYNTNGHRERSLFSSLLWSSALCYSSCGKNTRRLNPTMTFGRAVLIASQDPGTNLVLGPYPEGEWRFCLAGEKEFPFLGSKGPSDGTEKGTGLQVSSSCCFLR